MNKVIICIVYLSWIHIPIFATSDKSANPETKALLDNLLHVIAGEGIMIGHQNDVIGGKSNRGWKDTYFRVSPDTVYNSDIFQICGDYPAVHGFDIGGIGVSPLHQNLDWHNLEFMRKAIIAAYHRNAIITVSYHIHNPITYSVVDSVVYTDSVVNETGVLYTDSVVYTSTYNYGAWVDSKNPEKYEPFSKGLLVQDSALNDTLNAFLRAAGNYFNSLITRDTIPNPDNPADPIIRDITVPVIFRPYHELNSGHFWWGLNTCTEEEYVALWKYTFNFLSDSMDVHNLLYCFSPYGRTSEAEYLYAYPGDDYVDILGFEANEQDATLFSTSLFNEKVDVVYHLAQEKGKPFALTETGLKNPTIANTGGTYFSDYFKWLYNDNEARYISYVLFWRNLGNEFKVPYVGNDLVTDFQEVYNSPHLAKFESDLSDQVLNHGLGPYVTHPDNFPTTNEYEFFDNIYAWPINGNIAVHVKDASQLIVEVYDLNGKKLFSGNVAGETGVCTVGLKSQLCIVKIQTDFINHTQKIWIP